MGASPKPLETKMFGGVGPKLGTTRISVVSRFVHGFADSIRGSLVWRHAFQLLHPSATAEALQCQSEIGCVWRTCGDTALTWGHAGAGEE